MIEGSSIFSGGFFLSTLLTSSEMRDISAMMVDAEGHMKPSHRTCIFRLVPINVFFFKNIHELIKYIKSLQNILFLGFKVKLHFLA